MTDEPMTNEECYHFDAFGYLIIRNALTPTELKRCVRALEQIDLDEVPVAAAHRYPFLQLRDHPVLVRYATELCGDGFRVDDQPRLVGRGRGDEEVLTDGSEWVDWSRAYRHDHGVRLCQRLQAYWALADVDLDDGGFVLIPASHNSLVDTPPEVIDGTDDMGLVHQPTLNEGDLLLVAGNTVQGARPWRGKGPQRLLGWSYIAAGLGNEALGKSKSLPEWTSQLTPEQRAVVHNPDPDAPQLHVTTDGEKSWIEERVDHPSIYLRDSDSSIDEKEFYHWDLCGHLVVGGIMDEAWLRAANAAIDAFPELISKEPTNSYGDSKSLKSEGHRSSMRDLWNLPAPHCEPFRRMIAHPALIQRLNWMMGSGYGVTQCNAFLSEKGGSGLFFLASAQTHGAFAWQGEMPRRGILMSYRSRNIFSD